MDSQYGDCDTCRIDKGFGVVMLVVYSEEELKRIQSIELEALRVLIDVCESLEIEYFAIGGTALGAVRHRGFIPWDDDIDIAMTRPNYQRFLREAPSALPKGYTLQSPYDGTKEPYPYAKLRVDGTVFMEYCNRALATHQGVYIDIFPYDEVPDDESLNRAQFKSIRALVRVFTLRQTPDVSVEPESAVEKARAMLRKAMHLVCKVVPYRGLVAQIDAYATRYNGTGQKAMASLFFPRRKVSYGLKETLFPVASLEFEGLTINVPHDCDTYLKTHYGNYLEFPAPEKRYGHKPYCVKV